jgi:hypothetical protein
MTKAKDQKIIKRFCFYATVFLFRYSFRWVLLSSLHCLI